MFHPGKIQEILKPEDKNIESSDKSCQAIVYMWDDNLITVNVDSVIASKIKKNDIVLVDYRPAEGKPVPRLNVIKILKTTIGKSVWETYKNFQKTRNPKGTKGIKLHDNYVG